MSKKTFPAALRVLTSVVNPLGPDSLEAINTTELPDGCLCVVTAIPAMYEYRKTSSAAADGVNIVAPVGGGAGRWFQYRPGPTSPTGFSVAVPTLGPNSTGEVTVTIPGKVSSGDLVNVNISDTGLSSGIGLVAIRPAVGATTAALRFANVTGATIAGATISARASVVLA